MHRLMAVATAFFMALIACSCPAFGQSKPACEQGRVVTPEKVEGEVVKIDAARNRLSVREADGKVHEFEASKETLQDFKVGDRIEANARGAEVSLNATLISSGAEANSRESAHGGD